MRTINAYSIKELEKKNCPLCKQPFQIGQLITGKHLKLYSLGETVHYECWKELAKRRKLRYEQWRKEHPKNFGFVLTEFLKRRYENYQHPLICPLCHKPFQINELCSFTRVLGSPRRLVHTSCLTKHKESEGYDKREHGYQ